MQCGGMLAESSSARWRLKARGLVDVRRYRSKERQTPFKEGYLITWMDSNKPREKAIEEAVKRTDDALAGMGGALAQKSAVSRQAQRPGDLVSQMK